MSKYFVREDLNFRIKKYEEINTPEIIPNISNPPRSIRVTLTGKSLINVSLYEYARMIGRKIPMRNTDFLFLNVTTFLKNIPNPITVKTTPVIKITIHIII